MTVPLEGVQVLDVGGSITAYTARILSDLGAEVVVVEPPDGHELRHRPPYLDGTNVGLLFAYYHAGNRSVVLDMEAEDVAGEMENLARGADVVLLSPSLRRPLAGWDRDALTLSWVGDEVILCAITPFGLTGPCRDWRATPMTSFAMSGSMHHVGPVDGPPVAVPGRQQWDKAGIYGAIAVLAALRARPLVAGQLIDLSVHEVACQTDFLVERYDTTGMAGDWGRQVAVGYPPTGTYKVKDGFFDVAAHQPRHWAAFLKMLDEPEELADPVMSDPLIRRQLHDVLPEIIGQLVAGRELEDLLARGQASGLPCSMLNTPAQFVADVHMEARGTFVPIELPELGRIRVPGPGYRAEPPLTRRRGPVPAVVVEDGDD